MDSVVRIVLIIFGTLMTVIFSLLSKYFWSGRGWQWVNVLDDKESYQEKEVLRFLGKVMLAFAASGILWILAGVAGAPWLLWGGYGWMLLVAIFTLVYMNTGNRFKKQ